jgi:uncharacterized protein
MRCRYCFYHDVAENREIPSFGIMSEDTMIRIIDSVYKDLDDGDTVTLAFQGGEPTLAGLEWFKEFVSYTNSQKSKVTIHYSLQTNGLLIDDAWGEFLHTHNFLVGLSIDGTAKFHDKNRIDAKGEGTFSACLKTKGIFEKHKVEYNILSVLTNDLASDPDKVWRFIINEKIKFIQFIPCLDILRPAKFAQFYIRLYYWWLKELEKGNYISVKFFDDTANFFLKGLPNACGITGQCQCQNIIEADGSLYPCDFYTLDEYKAGNLTVNTLHEIFDTERVQNFIKEKHNLPALCNSCKYVEMCRGGCKRMAGVMYCGSGGTVCGYKLFLDKCLEPLSHTVRRYFP